MEGSAGSCNPLASRPDPPFDDLFELPGIKRLEKIRLCTGLHGGERPFTGLGGRDNDHRQRGLFLPDLAQDHETAHFRHVNVRDQGIELLAADRQKRFAPVGGSLDDIAIRAAGAWLRYGATGFFFPESAGAEP